MESAILSIYSNQKIPDEKFDAVRCNRRGNNTETQLEKA